MTTTIEPAVAARDLDVFATPFARDQFMDKYSYDKKEKWSDTADRVVENVCGPLISNEKKNAIRDLIVERKFIPGGRYLYASGRPFHQVNNCYEGNTRFLTRNGTRTLRECAGQNVVLMTTGGKWVDAEIRSFGIQPLLKVVMKRAGIEKEIFATSGHSWRVAKNTSREGRPANKVEKTTEELREGDRLWSVFGYGSERSEPCPAGIQHGLVYGDGTAHTDDLGWASAHIRLCGEKNAQLLQHFSGYPVRKVAEDGSEDRIVSKLPRHYKKLPDLTYDRSYLYGWLMGYFAADGTVGAEGKVVISSTDEASLKHVREVCYLLGIGTFGIRHSDRVSNLTGEDSRLFTLAFMRETLSPDFFLIKEHRERFVANPPERSRAHWTVVSVESTERVEEVFCAVVPGTHEFVLEDNILTGNCMLFRADDSREGWAEIGHSAFMALMTGAGIGIDYSAVRPEDAVIGRTGGRATGPIALMKAVNEIGRQVMQGGSRRSAIWAGLDWRHSDVKKFLRLKDWPKELRDLKEKDLTFELPMELTNISIIYDADFFKAYESGDAHAREIWRLNCRQAFKTAEPGFSINFKNPRESLRNACCEVVSEDDSDKCNLGTLWMQRFSSKDELARAVHLSTLFLLCGGLYSDVPTEKIREIGNRNNRIGLGMGGLHEWLMVRNSDYEVTPEMHEWLAAYRDASDEAALKYSRELGVNEPKGKRAFAPNGTIGIVAESTTSIEPLFCAAYKRRYFKNGKWHYQYVVDGSVKRLMDKGVKLEVIERNDAYALDFEQRVKFQADVQDYVDMSISSTCNMPKWDSVKNNDDNVDEKAKILFKYGPRLRGFTCYPDGARGGQPLTKVSVKTATEKEGHVFIEEVRECTNGVCGF